MPYAGLLAYNNEMRFLSLAILVEGCAPNYLMDNQANPEAGTAIDLLMSLPDFAVSSSKGVECGNMYCPIGKLCCMSGSFQSPSYSCGDTCPDGSSSMQCDGPAQCNGNPCCMSDSMGGNNKTVCTKAPSDCPGNFEGNGVKSRRCHTTADCTAGLSNTEFNTCCTFKYGGYHVCANSFFAMQSHGAISCP